MEPITAYKSTVESLEANVHLLPNEEEAEHLLEDVRTLFSAVDSQRAELDQVMTSVSGWWGECEGVREKVRQVEVELSGERPLASSLAVICQQDEAVEVSAV